MIHPPLDNDLSSFLISFLARSSSTSGLVLTGTEYRRTSLSYSVSPTDDGGPRGNPNTPPFDSESGIAGFGTLIHRALRGSKFIRSRRGKLSLS